MATSCVVLVSLGRNPVSGRRRVAPQDLRALALAIALGHQPLALHAGAADDAGLLQDVLGRGAAELRLLTLSPRSDPLPALLDYLRPSPPHLLFCGKRADDGEGSGLLPFLLAQGLGHPLLSDIAQATPLSGGTIRFVKALPGGERRVVETDGPVIASIGDSGPAIGISAYGPARRGKAVATAGKDLADPRIALPLQTARQRPRPIARPRRGEGMGALAAILDGGASQNAGRRMVTPSTPQEAARALLAELAAIGVFER